MSEQTKSLADKINEATAVTLATSVSPTLHPDAIMPHGPALASDESTAPAYRAARAAQGALYIALAEMTAAVKATQAESSTNGQLPEAAAEHLINALGARFAAVARAVDRNTALIQETADRLAGRIDTALTNPKRNEAGVAQAAGDIRRFVANLAASERTTFLYGCAENHDLEVISACLQTTPWVSGLNRAQMTDLRDLAAQHFAPKEHAALGAARKVLDHLRTASNSFVESYRKLLPKVKPSAAVAAMAALKGAAT